MKIVSKALALIVAVSLVALLAGPSPTHAASGEEVAIYIGVGALIFVGLVIVGTLLTREEHKMFLTEEEQLEETAHVVEFGPQCIGPDGRPALICW